MKLSELKIGEKFTVAGIEFFKVKEEKNRCFAVSVNSIKNMEFGKNNNFADSKILSYLKSDVLPKIENEIGAENIIEFTTSLTSLDGLKDYGEIKEKISIPTFDFYRENVEIFDKYKLDWWWWTATPDTTKTHGSMNWITSVSPGGIIGCRNCIGYCGVRPFLCFLSDISVS